MSLLTLTFVNFEILLLQQDGKTQYDLIDRLWNEIGIFELVLIFLIICLFTALHWVVWRFYNKAYTKMQKEIDKLAEENKHYRELFRDILKERFDDDSPTDKPTE